MRAFALALAVPVLFLAGKTGPKAPGTPATGRPTGAWSYLRTPWAWDAARQLQVRHARHELSPELRVARIARRYIGVPYRYGGTSPAGFDCSGFTRFVYSKLGIDLPHNAAQQFGVGRPVGRGDLRPGDLVFFRGLGHVGLYIGHGLMIHSPQSGETVRIERVSAHGLYVGARRVLRARHPRITVTVRIASRHGLDVSA
jgi:cell wall-associated NlpC family hydrolase